MRNRNRRWLLAWISLFLLCCEVFAGNGVQNSTRIENSTSQKELRSVFSPRMDYEQWTPLGRGDPLKNDPTYDYVPPVLERVHYWMDPSIRKPDTLPSEQNQKTEILLLGVSSSKPSTQAADSRRDIYDPFIKFVDGPKFSQNYQRQSRPHYFYYPTHYKNKAKNERVPYTILMPPPAPKTVVKVDKSISSTTDSSVTVQEANLIYQSSTDEEPDKHVEPSSVVTWRTPLPYSDYKNSVLSFAMTLNSDDAQISGPDVMYKGQVSDGDLDPSSTYVNIGKSEAQLHPAPMIIKPDNQNTMFVTPDNIKLDNQNTIIVKPENQLQFQQEVMIVKAENQSNHNTIIVKPGSLHAKPENMYANPDIQMHANPEIHMHANPDIHMHAKPDLQIHTKPDHQMYHNTLAKPENHVKESHKNGIFYETQLLQNPLHKPDALKFEDYNQIHALPMTMQMQTMQPPPPSKKIIPTLASLLQKEATPYQKEPESILSTMASMLANIPKISTTTATPPTTTTTTLTTDPLFKHYKQPSEPLRGPMYLIIQGHSKVKTYGPAKQIHGIKIQEFNEIPNLDYKDEYQVKHLHSYRKKLEDHPRMGRANQIKSLAEVLQTGFGAIDGAKRRMDDFQEAELIASVDVGDVNTEEVYHKGYVEVDKLARKLER